jgi:hypothetical protein
MMDDECGIGRGWIIGAMMGGGVGVGVGGSRQGQGQGSRHGTPVRKGLCLTRERNQTLLTLAHTLDKDDMSLVWIGLAGSLDGWMDGWRQASTPFPSFPLRESPSIYSVTRW